MKESVAVLGLQDAASIFCMEEVDKYFCIYQLLITLIVVIPYLQVGVGASAQAAGAMPKGPVPYGAIIRH